MKFKVIRLVHILFANCLCTFDLIESSCSGDIGLNTFSQSVCSFLNQLFLNKESKNWPDLFETKVFAVTNLEQVILGLQMKPV